MSDVKNEPAGSGARRDREDDVEHADDDRAPDALNEGGDREDELLDEGVEETFPASDPVSVKHIT